ncbi:hypothetical protein [Luteimonas aestuarii]|nr:hypothetical protein [Luteimonas aestuarii]
MAILSKQLTAESYEGRQRGKPHTQYALGAMAEVDADYTRISVETAERVGNQLARRLPDSGIPVEFRLQGSVPLNVHIRGISDVDLLVIATRSLFYAAAGVRAQRGEYTAAAVSPLALLSSLRRESEQALQAAYAAVDVDVDAPKAIKLAGGSLARPVDVVPSVWWDTLEYQRTGSEVERGVSIYDKAEHRSIENLPFLHIAKVAELDAQVSGGLRKAIRLCKNLKADLEEEGSSVALSSYDIAGLLCHSDLATLRSGCIWELAVLAEAQRHFDWCYAHPHEAQRLVTPDGSRRILDTPERVAGVLTLSVELDRLTKHVAREQSSLLALQDSPALTTAREVLTRSVVL